jgi:hypothetical protein
MHIKQGNHTVYAKFIFLQSTYAGSLYALNC